MVIKRDFTSSKWEHINPELFLCADKQGYSIKFGNKVSFDLLVVIDLGDIQKEEDKKQVAIANKICYDKLSMEEK